MSISPTYVLLIVSVELSSSAVLSVSLPWIAVSAAKEGAPSFSRNWLIFPGRRATSKVAWLMPYTPLNRSASDTVQDAGRHSSLHLWPTWVSALHNSCCDRSIWRRAIHGKQNLKTSALFYLEAAALETEQHQWWRNFRWSQQQQLPKKQQQGLMSRWQRLMEIQVAGRMWLHQLIRRRIGQCLLVAQCAMWWKKRLSLNSCGEWVGVQISNWPQDSWARAQMMQITTYAPSFSGSII